jgi:DNA-binding response OmpR family regulator
MAGSRDVRGCAEGVRSIRKLSSSGRLSSQPVSLTQGREAELFERSVDPLVSRLRQRLRDETREPRYIVRSEGHVLSMRVESADD